LKRLLEYGPYLIIKYNKIMTTIVNTPPNSESSSSGAGIVIGVIASFVLVVLFFIFALPAIRANMAPKSDNININIELPVRDITPPPVGDSHSGTVSPSQY